MPLTNPLTYERILRMKPMPPAPIAGMPPMPAGVPMSAPMQGYDQQPQQMPMQPQPSPLNAAPMQSQGGVPYLQSPQVPGAQSMPAQTMFRRATPPSRVY